MLGLQLPELFFTALIFIPLSDLSCTPICRRFKSPLPTKLIYFFFVCSEFNFLSSTLLVSDKIAWTLTAMPKCCPMCQMMQDKAFWDGFNAQLIQCRRKEEGNKRRMCWPWTNQSHLRPVPAFQCIHCIQEKACPLGTRTSNESKATLPINGCR